MLREYIDDKYAVMPIRFIPEDLVQIWNPEEMTDDVDYFRYTNFPVTIDNSQYVILTPSGNVPQLETGWKTLWRWKTYAIPDTDNMAERQTGDLKRILLFESVNNTLTLKPQMIGSQSAELYLTDLYGNVISNTDGGNLYVNE